MGKPEGRRPFVRLRCKLENNVNRNRMVLCGLNSSGPARDKWWIFVNTVMSPPDSIQFGEFLD